MIEEEREEKKRKKKDETFWEYFIYSMLQKCAAAAIEAAMNELFGEPSRTMPLDDLEMLLYDELEPAAEDALTDLFSDWL